MSILFILHFAATWFMTGLIWFVQVVHYPLYDKVGIQSFAEYERIHCALTTLVVAPVMLAELFSGFALIASKPRFMTSIDLALDLVLLALIWFSTFFIADQLHGGLAASFDSRVLTALVNWNWLRTVAWTLRALALCYVLWKAIE